MPIYTCTRTVMRKDANDRNIRQECGQPATNIILLPSEIGKTLKRITPRCKNHISINKRLTVSSFGNDGFGRVIPVEEISEEDALIYEVMKS